VYNVLHYTLNPGSIVAKFYLKPIKYETFNEPMWVLVIPHFPEYQVRVFSKFIMGKSENYAQG
jgi:hypothetical protein